MLSPPLEKFSTIVACEEVVCVEENISDELFRHLDLYNIVHLWCIYTFIYKIMVQ